MTRAFVQITLGVVAAVLVAGLILTAIRKAQASAAQAQCMNNGKQIGIALNNYHSVNDHFPPGTLPNAAVPPERRLSWVVPLILFMEAVPYADVPLHKFAWDAPENAARVRNRFTFIRCPLQPDKQSTEFQFPGVAGVGPDAVTLPSGDPRAGVFGYDRHTALADITDGPADTLVVLESRTAGPWAQGGPATVRGLDPAARPHLGAGRPFETFHPDGFGLAGPRTFSSTGVFADGSVRVFRESVDPEVLEGLATIAGKEPAPPNE